MTQHWCDEHPVHATGPGVTTDRASAQLARAAANNPTLVGSLAVLTGAGIISKWDARMALIAAGEAGEKT